MCPLFVTPSLDTHVLTPKRLISVNTQYWYKFKYVIIMDYTSGAPLILVDIASGCMIATSSSKLLSPIHPRQTSHLDISISKTGSKRYTGIPDYGTGGCREGGSAGVDLRAYSPRLERCSAGPSTLLPPPLHAFRIVAESYR